MILKDPKEALRIRDFLFRDKACDNSVKRAAELIHSFKPISFSEVKSMWADHIRVCDNSDIHSLYIHMPFCVSKCSFCSCYSRVGSDCEIKEYSEKLIKHLKNIKDFFKGFSFDNLYIGGGTPTIMDEGMFKEFIDTIFSSFSFTGKGQLCSEMDPSTCSPEKLALLKAHNFTRVSFGVQSFNTEVLKLNNRGHQTEEMVRQAVSDAKKAGFKYINVDLLVGLYGDTSESLVESFRKAIDIGAQKISVYALQPIVPYLDERFESDTARFDSSWQNIFNESIEKISALAKKARFSTPDYSDWYMKMLSCSSWSYQDENIPSEDLEYIPEMSNQSVLGIGENASSMVWGVGRYKTAFSFSDDPELCPYAGDRKDERDGMIDFIISEFSRKIKLSFAEFKGRFHKDFLEEFAFEIERLKSLNAAVVDNEGLSLIAEDKAERSAHVLMFFSDEEIDSAIKENCNNKTDIFFNRPRERNSDSRPKLKSLNLDSPEQKKAWASFRQKANSIFSEKEKEVMNGILIGKEGDFLILSDNDGKEFRVKIADGCLFGRDYVSNKKSVMEKEISLDDILSSKNHFVIFCLKQGGKEALIIKELIDVW